MCEYRTQSHVSQTGRGVGDVRQEGHRVAGEEAEGQTRRVGIPGDRHHYEWGAPDEVRHDTTHPGWSSTGGWKEGLSACHLCPTLEVARLAQE